MASCDLEISIFDICGRIVKTFNTSLTDQMRNYNFYWKGGDDSGKQVASGLYFIKISSGDCTIVKQVTYLK
jgi:flagellar hook assembly protein FlgD